MEEYRELPWERIRVNSLTRGVDLKIKRKALSCSKCLERMTRGPYGFGYVLGDALLGLDGRRPATKAYWVQ